MAANKATTPNIIGIYGLPGAGKSTLLSQLQLMTETSPVQYDYHEGSKVIDFVVDGGLTAFKKLPHADKQRHRAKAIKQIGNEARRAGKGALVAGHFMLPLDMSDVDSNMVLAEVYTQADLETFTHIVYLKVAPEVINRQRAADLRRTREVVPVEELEKWQNTEMEKLFDLCIHRGIVFATVIGGEEKTVQRVADLCSFWNLSEDQNLNLAVSMVEETLCGAQLKKCTTILAFDADRTLAPHDSGTMFMQKAFDNGLLEQGNKERMTGILKRVFSGPLGYTHRAFQQVSVLLESLVYPHGTYDSICSMVADQITMYPEFAAILLQAAQDPRVVPVVVTSGVRRVWEIVLQRMELQEIPILGGGRVKDQYVVTPKTKAGIVEWLATSNTEGRRREVVVYGDSPLDIPMMVLAEQVFVIVGDKDARSGTMDAELEKAISSNFFRKSHGKKFDTSIAQVLMPSTVTPRPKLPIAELHYPMEVPKYIAASAPAKLLASPMRNASIAGPDLQEAHFHVGQYLATQLITEAVGLEEYTIPHVQGLTTVGHQLKAENRTLIVAMMRGGEPMARGAQKAFPLSVFAFAKHPHEIAQRDVAEMANILLIDSVVNTGKSMIDFVEHIRGMNSKAKILLVAGVVQAGTIEVSDSRITERASLREKLGCHGDVGIVALRVSENKYTGVRGTDTGNRLFNTTHWD